MIGRCWKTSGQIYTSKFLLKKNHKEFSQSIFCAEEGFKQGFWYFTEKKSKFRGIFRGKFAEKSADFAGFSQEKSQNSRNNRPISGDFRGRKVKIRRKIGPFRGILAEKSQFSKDFQGQIIS